jgi:hypothetical protein
MSRPTGHDLSRRPQHSHPAPLLLATKFCRLHRRRSQRHRRDLPSPLLHAMNTDITASTKPEYPVVDRNPAFTKVVGNFSALDYMRLSTISAVSVTVGYLSGSPTLPNLISHFTPIGSSDPCLPCRDQAGDPGPVDGHGRPHRGHGRVHVRLPELRRAPNGILSQRRRGCALQAQASLRIQLHSVSLFATVSPVPFLIPC